jgi:hypothetical protein
MHNWNSTGTPLETPLGWGEGRSSRFHNHFDSIKCGFLAIRTLLPEISKFRCFALLEKII